MEEKKEFPKQPRNRKWRLEQEKKDHSKKKNKTLDPYKKKKYKNDWEILPEM